MSGQHNPMPTPGFWRGRRVMVTGHTGFKGSWLCTWLEHLGAQTLGLSLPDPSSGSPLWEALHLENVAEVRADIATRDWQEAVVAFDPQVVFHLAAQALVSVGYSDPLRTFTTNVHGSVQMLSLFSDLPGLEAAVMVTTDKVYDPSQPTPFSESSFLGGHDPYSASKAAMELAVHSWPALQFPVVTARAGNVIGGGDASTDRLLPDLIRCWSKGDVLTLRRPAAVRPWQHVLEPLRGYLLYAERLLDSDLPSALNLGPDEGQCVSVDEVVRHAAEHWTSTDEHGRTSSPTWVALDEPQMEETDLLVLDSGLARDTVGWSNILDWRQAVALTIDWHRAHAKGVDAHNLVLAEISDYSLLVESTV